jgi:hypothetical protein
MATICDSLNFDFFIEPPWMQNPARKVQLRAVYAAGKLTLRIAFPGQFFHRHLSRGMQDKRH